MARLDTFNRWLAVKITGGVATMWCAYGFGVLALLGFPGVRATAPQYIQWVSQTFIQLVMLSVIMVGQDQHHTATQRTLAEHHESHKRELAGLHAKVDEQASTLHTTLSAVRARNDALPKPRAKKGAPNANTTHGA